MANTLYILSIESFCKYASGAHIPVCSYETASQTFIKNTDCAVVSVHEAHYQHSAPLKLWILALREQ